MYKSCQIIFTPAAQAQAGCKGPEFKNPEDVLIAESGVTVYTVTKDTSEPCLYFYPLHQIARVKIVDFETVE